MSGDADGAVYVGPRPFEIGEADWFFGRNLETEILSNLGCSGRVVLLFAPSGAGKSSLIRAGLHPDLTKERPKRRGRQRTYRKMRTLPFVKVSTGAVPDTTPPIDNIFVYGAVSHLVPHRAADEIAAMRLIDALAPFFASAEEQSGDAEPTLLVFDQFEEIFTFHLERWRDREGFFKQVAEAIEAYPTLHVMFSMREDYIAELTPYAGLLPGELRTQFRLEPLKYEAAVEAVKLPAERAGVPFEEGVAEALVDELRRSQLSARQGGDAAVGAYVEPVQLQIVCRQLWANLPPDATAITAAHVKQYGDVDRALSDFYESTLRSVIDATSGQTTERALRDWFSEKLITPAGTRGLVYRGADATEGLPNAVVDRLSEAWIIRADKRGGDTWFELSHDRLVEPILGANNTWRAKHHNPVTELASAWAAAGRPPAMLAEGRQLEMLERFAGDAADQVSDGERAYLDESRRVADATAAEILRRRRLRHRMYAAAGIFLATVSILALYARSQATEARAQTKVAEEQTKVAVAATAAAKAAAAIGWAAAESRRDPTVAALFLQAAARPDTASWAAAYRALLHHALADQLTELDGPAVAGAWHPRDGRYVTLTATTLSVHEGERDRSVPVSGALRGARWRADGGQLMTIEGGVVRLRDALLVGEPRRSFGTKVGKAWYVGVDDFLTLGGGKVTRWRGDRATELPQPGNLFGSVVVGRHAAITAHNDGVGRYEVRVYDLGGEATEPTARLQLETDLSRFPITSVGLRQDGRALAFATGDFVYLWGALPTDGSLRLASSADRLAGESWVYEVAWRPDGQRLAAGTDHGLVMWDDAGKVIERFPSRQSIRQVVWSADGERLMTVGRDGLVTVRDADGAPFATLIHPGEIVVAAFDASGERILTAGRDGTARVWRLDRVPLDFAHPVGVRQVTWRPDGGEIMTNIRLDDRGPASLHFWPQTPSGRRATLSFDRPVWDAAYATDGRRVAVGLGYNKDSLTPEMGAHGGALAIWGRGDAGWRELGRWPREDKVHAVAWGAGDAFVAGGGNDGRTLIVQTGPPMTPLADTDIGLNERGRTSWVRAVGWRPTCTKGEASCELLTSDTDGLGRIYRPATQGAAVVAATEDFKKWAQAGAWRPDGRQVATATRERTVIWDPATGKPVAELDADGIHRRVLWSPDQAYIAVVIDKPGPYEVAFWATAGIEKATAQAPAGGPTPKLKPSAHGPHALAIQTIAWHPSGRYLASGATDRTVRIWRPDNPDGEPVRLIQNEGHINDLAWSPDGGSLLFADSAGHAQVFRLPPAAIEAPRDPLRATVHGCVPLKLRMDYLGETEAEARAACATP